MNPKRDRFSDDRSQDLSEVWSNQVEDDQKDARAQNRRKKAKSPLLGNLVAFGLPFIAVLAFVGIKNNFFLPNEDNANNATNQIRRTDSDDALETVEKTDSSKTVNASEKESQILFDSQNEASEVVVSDSTENALINAEILDATESDFMLELQEKDADLEVEKNEEGTMNASAHPDEQSTEIGFVTENDENETESEVHNSSELEEQIDSPSEEFFTQESVSTVPIRLDEKSSREALAQLEHQVLEIKKGDERNPDALIEQLTPALKQARSILELVDESFEENVNALIKSIEDFQEALKANKEFMILLREFDRASLTQDATVAFLEEHEEAFVIDPNANPKFNERKADFLKAAEMFERFVELDAWNYFVEARRLSLERFRVPQEDAQAALDFVRAHENSLLMPYEWDLLKRRVDEWAFQTQNVTPMQRKILLRIEAEASQKYWTYAPSEEKRYYLPAPPKPGLNNYVADANGTLKQVEIPASAPETHSVESLQTRFLRSLSAKVRQIPDSLVDDDPARWYEEWKIALLDIQTTNELDPIVQYVLFRDCAKILASGDYFFAIRLKPLLRMMNIPQLSEEVVDRFQTESLELQKIRALASSRLRLLPKDHLNVDKTTEQLNDSVVRFSCVYKRVGWLDRDFADSWKCRRPENALLPIGDLYVVIPMEPVDANSKPTFKWSKIGSSDGNALSLNLATNSIPVGSIVLCRVDLNQESRPIPKKAASVESFFQR